MSSPSFEQQIKDLDQESLKNVIFSLIEKDPEFAQKLKESLEKPDSK